jgi:hypothetical protein
VLETIFLALLNDAKRVDTKVLNVKLAHYGDRLLKGPWQLLPLDATKSQCQRGSLDGERSRASPAMAKTSVIRVLASHLN